MDYDSLDFVVRLVQQKLCCSVLPLEGKRPASAIKTWKQFRRNKPTPKEIEEWFVVRKLQAYGVILGKSAGGLFVIDFDDPEVYEELSKNHPKIDNTFTVKTRRGYHAYLRSDQSQTSQKFTGGDIKGEGSYVVGPESTVEGYQYTVHQEKTVQQITATELQVIKHELGIQSITTTENRLGYHNRTAKQITEFLQTQYKRKVIDLGRNNALYHVARAANYGDIPENTTQQALTQLHAKTRPTGTHKEETQKSRLREATLTIRSAYKIKKRNRKNTIQKETLPNNIREKLLQTTGSTAPGRFIEALIKLKHQEKQTITKTEAYKIGQQFHISNRDIRKSLGTRINNKPVFKAQTINSHSHNTSPHVGEVDRLNNKLTGTRGRPIHIVYQIPSIELLCQLFNVTIQSSDPLSVGDLSSAKAYRKALHRELIKRQSPDLSMRWHAERLGVSKRTVRRYNHELGVIRTPIIGYVPLTDKNVDDPRHYGTPSTPLDFTPGKWLQRRDGKRFPALKGIALSQLRNAQQLIACHQHPSRLQLPSIDQPLILHDVLWRRMDQPGQIDWGGRATDFPPVDPLPEQYRPIISLSEYLQKEPESPEIEPLSVDRDSQLPVIEHHVSPQINNRLTLIRGIGERRAERLYDLGISTMTHLIAAGAEKIAAIGWAGGYVTNNTTASWILEAQQLLGLQENGHSQDSDVVLKNRQKQSKLFRHHLKSYKTYLEKLTSWEDDIFGTGKIKTLDWNRELSWVQYQFENNQELGNYLPHEQERYRKRISQFISDYIERIDTFITMESNKLDKLGFGTMKGWRSLRRRSLTQQRYFDKHEDRE